MNARSRVEAHLVFLRSGLVLTKQLYGDWREIQVAYDDFMTSLGPFTEAETGAYFEHDYGADDAHWPWSRAQLAAFFASSAEVLFLNEATGDRS